MRRFFSAFLLCWLFSVASAVVDGPLTITQFGADPLGVNDSAPAVQRALDTSNVVVIPPGHFRMDSYVTMRDNTMIYGAGGETSRLEPNGNNVGGITIGSHCTVRGVMVDCSVHHSNTTRCIYFPSAAKNHSIVEQCTFYGDSGTIGIYAEPVLHNDNTVRNNYFNSGGWGCEVYEATRWSFVGNQFLSCGHAITVHGASGSIFVNNNIVNGTTGILGLAWRSNGVKSATFIGNTFANNTVIGTSEEGISLDMNGNVPTNWSENGTNPIVTFSSHVAGATTDVVTIAETGQAGGWANNYYAVNLNGNNMGHVAQIISSQSGQITLDLSNGTYAAFAGTDKFLITAGTFHNTITGNVISQAGTAGITLWGSHWHNVISNNSIYYARLYGISTASPVQTLGTLLGGWGLQGWAGFDTISHNTIFMGGVDFAHSPRWPIYVALYVYSTPSSLWPHMPGTVIDGNTIDSSLPAEINGVTYTRILNENKIAGASWTLTNTDHCTYGRNYIGGLLDAAGPTLSGSNTNLTLTYATLPANIVGPPADTDHNAILNALRAAGIGH